MSIAVKLVVSTLITSLISGCAVKQVKPEPSTSSKINDNIELAIRSIQKTQIELYQYSAISQRKNGITGGIYSDRTKIDANWNGDAAELLKKMAEQRQYSFSTIGNKLPLPVTVKVDKSSYKEVLELIQVQIGYAASIMINNNRREMQLQYGIIQSNSVFGSHIIYQGDIPNAQTQKNTHKSNSFSSKSTEVTTKPKIGSICNRQNTLAMNKDSKWMRCDKGVWIKN